MVKGEDKDVDGGTALLDAPAEAETAAVTPVIEAVKPVGKGKYLEIPMKEIRPNPMNARKYFNREALGQLAASIKADGQIQAIAVRELEKPEKGVKYEIMAGERRYRAQEMNKAETIEAIVKTPAEIQRQVLSLVENLQRVELSAIEESDAYQQLILTGGFTIADSKSKAQHPDTQRLAERIGKSRSYVYQRLQLQKLIPEVRKLVAEGEIPASHAIEIARLGEMDQCQVAFHCIKSGWNNTEFKSPAQFQAAVEKELKKDDREACSYRDMMDYISRQVCNSLSKAAFDKADPDLITSVGPCTLCPKRSDFELGKPEIGKDSQCLERGCFLQKQKLNAKKVEGELKEAKVEYAKLGSYNDKGKDGIVYHGDLTECKKDDKGAKLVLNPETGEKKFMRTYQAENSASKPKRSEKEIEKERAEKAKFAEQAKLEKAWHFEISRDLLKQYRRDGLDFTASRYLIDAILDRSSVDERMSELMGWGNLPEGYQPREKFIKEKLDGMHAKDLVPLAVVVSLMDSEWQFKQTAMPLAQALKIDTKKCMERAKEQISGMSKPAPEKPEEKADKKAPKITNPRLKQIIAQAKPAKKTKAPAKAKKKK